MRIERRLPMLWAACLVVLMMFGGCPPHAAAVEYPGEESVRVPPGRSEVISLPHLQSDRLYSVLIYVPSPAALTDKDTLQITVKCASGTPVIKTLHAGDPDFYLTFKPTATGPGTLRIESTQGSGAQTVRYVVQPIPASSQNTMALAALPNCDWKSAQPIVLGSTIYASNDERSYIPPLAEPASVLSNLVSGSQWFTFEHRGPDPKLVHFVIDVLDRDVPVDIALFRQRPGKTSGELEPYHEGVERYNTEQSTKFHGLQKFIARVIQPGTYYLRAMGNHPWYRVRTIVYDAPPFDEPEHAIRTGLDYLLRKADSWHANTPRRGSVVLRTSNRLGETAQCIACHPTHFTTRAELIASENGWPVRERPALQFLTERLYNNPRPLYGLSDAVWARMISAPGNVLSRLAYMLATFESNISFDRRDGLLEPIGNFLEHYWSGVRSPITESNGNLPRISGFEVGMHSVAVFNELHRRTGLDKYRQLAAQVRQVLADGAPIDLIDLCWKVVALCEFDRTEFAPQISQLVEQLWAHQKPDGTWSVAFDKALQKDYDTGRQRPAETPKDADGKPKGSEFQTYHAIYALAKAGVPRSEPRLHRAVQWCLSRQWPHGGWQGNADFKNFDTVFRDSQYALMALTELHQGPNGRGWDAGFPPVSKSMPTNDVPALLHSLDQHWTDPGPEIVQAARALLRHPQPLVRVAAASMLGRLADTNSVEDLQHALGDGSKLVQRAAAWALRQVASRRKAGYDQIFAALNSPNDRERWGGLRIFNQHFKYLASDWRLAEALMRRLEQDPAPINRMAAAQALWQWWFWDPSDAHQSTIEDHFLARLATEQNSWARRNLIEGLHNVLDDNVRYLYNDWIPSLKAETQRDRVKSGHRAVASRQGLKVAQALSSGNELQRDGVLRSFYAFHLRETAADLDPAVAAFGFEEAGLLPGRNERGENTWLDGYKFAASFDPCTAGTGILGRIGNDTEPPVYYDEAAVRLADSFQMLLDDAGPERSLPVLRALRSTKGVPLNGAFSAQLLTLARDSAHAGNKEFDTLATEILPTRFTPSNESREVLAQILREDTGPSFKLASVILRGNQGQPLLEDSSFLASLQGRLSQTTAEPDLELLFEILLKATALQPRTEVRARVLELSRSGSDHLRKLALRTLLDGERFLIGTRARREFEADLHSADPGRFKEWLAAATSLDWRKSRPEAGAQLVLGTVTTGLASPDPEVQTAAIAAARSIPPLAENPGIRENMRLLSQDPNTEVRTAAQNFLAELDRRRNQEDTPRETTLDFEYFVKHVQPIFQRTAADGDSCARCHADHSVLRLIPSHNGQPLSDTQSRFNFLSTLKVVDLKNPEESLLLVKPRSTFEGIGQPENYRKTHGGDVRWPAGKEQEEYGIILRWIQGAKDSSRDGQASRN